MMKKEKNTNREKEFMDSITTEKSAAEIFSDIAATIKASHPGNISQAESRKLARNFIGFCQKVIEIQIRIEQEKGKAK